MKDDILNTIQAMPKEELNKICQSILHGLGFFHTTEFTAPDVPLGYREVLTRESTDGMFRTEESWLIVFAHPGTISGETQNILKAAINAAVAADVQNLFFIFWGELAVNIVEDFHSRGRDLGVSSIILTDFLAAVLTVDYASEALVMDNVPQSDFSFAHLRQCIKQQSQTATWRQHFQSLTSLPIRVQAQNTPDFQEADLVRAGTTGRSILLLGAPGAGKSTSLQVLAEELATIGGRTPVIMPLSWYEGDLIANIGKALAPERTPVPPSIVLDLVRSGTLTIILDGLNEVPGNLQIKLQAEIDRLIDPQANTSYSQWIVSGRKYDYEAARRPLQYLEQTTWELQPLTPDLIYSFLAEAINEGELQAKEIYQNLGKTIRDICSNPLLLNMIIVIYQETGVIPSGRGVVYRKFVDLLLGWGQEQMMQRKLDEFSEYLGYSIGQDEYYQIAQDLMRDLAASMITTSISTQETLRSFESTLYRYVNPHKAATALLNDLISRGILNLRGNRVSFMHHTFQEYFYALQMHGYSLEVLIPDEGVTGAQREALIFFVGISNNPDPLIERAVRSDMALAYEMIRDSMAEISAQNYYAVAKNLWNKTINQSGWIGQHKPNALRFKSLAARMGKSVEQLAREIVKPNDEISFADELMGFYQQLGDLKSQQQVVDAILPDSGYIPDDLLFRLAVKAYNEREYQKAIELYSQCLSKYPTSAGAWAGRANAYRVMGKEQEALADHRRAIELAPRNAVIRTNLASLLCDIGERERAIVELRQAIEHDSTYAPAYFELGKLVEAQDLEEAESYFARAAQYQLDNQGYLENLARVQVKLSHFADAIRSLKALIEINPTSRQIKAWKQAIARLRLELEKVDKRRSLRERMREQAEIPLPVFATEFLMAVGLQVHHITSQLLVAVNENTGLKFKRLPVILVDNLQLTAAMIRDSIDVLSAESKDNVDILIMTTAEIWEPNVRAQLLGYLPEHKIAVITVLEAEDAFLRSDRICYQLLDNAIRLTGIVSDPFRETEPVKEKVKFFGREEQIHALRLALESQHIVGLYGIHKIGKTSLLMRLQMALSKDIFVVAIEMDPSIKTDADLYRKILEKLPDTDRVQTDISSEYFLRLLTNYQTTRQRHNLAHSVLLMLDEYPFLIPDRTGRGGIRGYLNALGIFKRLCQEQEKWFNLLVCGRSADLGRVSTWNEGENPFIGMVQETFLGPLTQSETWELVENLGAKANITFTPEAIEEIFRVTGGHPFFVRILGSWLCRKHQTESKVVDVDVEMIEDATESYLKSGGDTALLLAIYEDRLTQDEQKIARALAMDGPIAQSVFMAEAGDSSDKRRRIRDAITNLLDTTVIQEDANHQLTHRYELLKRVIKAQVDMGL